tara:strand:- start:234 stop:425 length:192 start_codon:yes stop_codon:yes gene_type:complete
MKRSRYNLLPYFIDDEQSLAKRQAYVASCKKFFRKLSDKQQATSNKRQATSDKQQAPSLTSKL